MSANGYLFDCYLVMYLLMQINSESLNTLPGLTVCRLGGDLYAHCRLGLDMEKPEWFSADFVVSLLIPASFYSLANRIPNSQKTCCQVKQLG